MKDRDLFVFLLFFISISCLPLCSQNKGTDVRLLDKKGSVLVKEGSEWLDIRNAYLHKQDSICLGKNSCISFVEIHRKPGEISYYESQMGKHLVQSIIQKTLSQKEKNALSELSLLPQLYLAKSEMAKANATMKGETYKENNLALVKAIQNSKPFDTENSVKEISDYDIELKILYEDGQYVFNISNNEIDPLFFDIAYIENGVIKSIISNDKDYISRILAFGGVSLNVDIPDYFQNIGAPKVILIAFEKPFETNKLSAISRRTKNKTTKDNKVGFDLIDFSK